ncbi:MAG: hypothetical protein ABI197_12210 [Granulicella sp.]
MFLMGLGATTRALYFQFSLLYSIASALALLLSLVALWRTRNQPKLRSRFLSLSIVLPFACVAGMVTVLMVSSFFGGISAPEPSRGDVEVGSLPNGYVLSMSRDWQSGYISMGLSEHPSIRYAHRYAVTELQVSGDLLLGRSDMTEKLEMHYFLIDTRSGRLTEYRDLADLSMAARLHGVQLHLRSAHAVFSQRRQSWYALLLHRSLLLLSVGVLLEWLRRLWIGTRLIRAEATT